LAPSTVTYFRNATNSLATHLNSLGLSSSETFMVSLQAMCRTSPTKICADDLAHSLYELHGIQPHVLGASFVIRNELVALMSQGYKLEEAAHILADRIGHFRPSEGEVLFTPPEFEIVNGLHHQHPPLGSLSTNTTPSAHQHPEAPLQLPNPTDPTHQHDGPSESTISASSAPGKDTQSLQTSSVIFSEESAPIAHSNAALDLSRIDYTPPMAQEQGEEANPRYVGAEDSTLSAQSSPFARIKRPHHVVLPCSNVNENEPLDELAVPKKRFCHVEVPD